MPRKSKSKSKIAEVETASIDEPATHASASADVNSSPPVPKPEKKTPPQQAGPYEDRRKEMQRRLQKLVQEMRDSGCTEPVIKSAIIREKRKEEKKIIALEEKRVNEEKACANDVIIVPVAWKRNQSEKISVDVSCDNVRRGLFSAGLNPWLDCRREYSPGQKFAYWEHMGVKFRIEIGPEDISQGICRVVKAETPGAYLEHQREKPEMNLQSIIRTLAYMGLSKCQEMNADLMSSESLIEHPMADRAFGIDEPEDELGGNAVVPARTPNPPMKKFRRF